MIERSESMLKNLRRSVGAALLVVMILHTGAASASSTNTRVDPAGTVELAASGWLGGSGVTVYSNGNSAANTYGRSTVNGVYAGDFYQCVELVNRLYLTRGWISSTWWGNGNQLYANAPTTLTKEPNGSITYLNPGDVVSFNDGGAGHAGIVNAVSGSTVTLVNQNTQSVFTTITYNNRTLSNWAGMTPIGVIHAPTRQPSYVGHIVQWNGDTKAQKTAWLVQADNTRRWIDSSATYNCLKTEGAPGPDVLPAATLDRLPDQTGKTATCYVPPAPTASDRLQAGQGLVRGQSLRSQNGWYSLIMQGDGNLVLYAPGGRALWATYRTGGFVQLQPDGNFVEYDHLVRPVWSTGTFGSNRWLVVQDDGNVVIYAGTNAVWATNTAQPPPGPDHLNQNQVLSAGQRITSGDGRFVLLMQPDGNAVVYGPAGAIWSTRTVGSGADRLIMQGDGNLVLYTPQMRAVWSTVTGGSGANVVIMQSDSNLVVYAPSGAKWSSLGGRTY
jgi:hypothetical protein